MIAGYELLEELGRGGMGVVYKARQLQRDRIVALKMILAGRRTTVLQLARFRIEAEAVACLAHRNIVLIHHVGVYGGYPFVCLEFAPGGSLARKIAGKPQSPRWAAELAHTLALAVQHAHERSILHRDLKPANILLMEDGTPKITDFGLAKFSRPIDEVSNESGSLQPSPEFRDFYHLLKQWESKKAAGTNAISSSNDMGASAQHAASTNPAGPEGTRSFNEFVVQSTWQTAYASVDATSERLREVKEFVDEAERQSHQQAPDGLAWLAEDLTRTGDVMGSPQYMAPEQAAGRLQDIGPHTDVYGLGTVLYQMLTGRPPFEGKDIWAILRGVSEMPPRPPSRLCPDVPRELERICLKCLSKPIQERYQTAADLAGDLKRFLANPGLHGSIPTAALPNMPQEISTMPSYPTTETKSKSWWQFWRR
jgi:serine/threonine protein kinase